MLVTNPVCNKVAEAVYPDWYRVRKKIYDKNWSAVEVRSPYFSKNKIDLWKEKCFCGTQGCNQYWADPCLIQPSEILWMSPLPDAIDVFDYDYHFDGDDPKKINNWKYTRSSNESKS